MYAHVCVYAFICVCVVTCTCAGVKGQPMARVFHCFGGGTPLTKFSMKDLYLLSHFIRHSKYFFPQGHILLVYFERDSIYWSIYLCPHFISYYNFLLSIVLAIY